jgi:Fic family protein
VKRPPRAPALAELLRQCSPERLAEILALARGSGANAYLHWDEVRQRPPPTGLATEEWWLLLKLGRQPRALPLTDARGRPFVYCVADELLALLHEVDSAARGTLEAGAPLTGAESRDRYLITSLIEEALTSSQLEGASTTRRVAVEMLRSGRPPRDRSERMIASNFRAMEQVRRLRADPLTPERVLELHRLLVADTLEDPTAAGRLQVPGERRVGVYDSRDGTLLHEPPDAFGLPARLERMCAFANHELDAQGFLHPVLRAIALHFWLAYDHPFADGNGRVARALFYWSMLRSGYWLTEYLSISRLLRKAPAQYARAFLYSETDDNDLTYFFLHQLRVLRQSIEDLHAYLRRKSAQLRTVDRLLQETAALNHRQRALLAHALRHPGHRYTIASHQRSHRVAYATARADLLDLDRRGLLGARRVGRTFEFAAPEDLEARLRGEAIRDHPAASWPTSGG